MQPSKLIRISAGLALWSGVIATGLANVTISVDMDTGTAGIQPTRVAAAGNVFTVALVMTVDTNGILNNGVSSYGISANFDKVELTLNGAPASTEALPPGFTFNGSAGVFLESQALGRVWTFEAGTLGLGPTAATFTIGTIAYTATAPVTDGTPDISLGLFNAGFDGVFDNLGNDVSAGVIFNNGFVNAVPEPSTWALLLCGTAVPWLVRRRWAKR